MKSQRYVGLLIGLLIALLLITVAPLSVQSQSSPTILTKKTRAVDKLFASFISADGPGGAVIVIQKGKVLYQAAYGLVDLKRETPLTPQHIFHIGSIGKQFTALGIMMFYEAGKLRYDDPIHKFLPELPAWSNNVTIRHLLHHTGGLSDYSDEILEGLEERSDAPTSADLLAVVAQIDSLPSAPGEVFEYSNVGYDLLGLIIERLAGKSYPDFMQTRIFTPLGMKHTFSVPNPKRLKDPLIAHSYESADAIDDPYDSDPFDNLVGSGSFYSTVEDMFLYDQALYTNKLLKPATLAEAFKPGTLTSGKKTDYGFAWEVEKWQRRSYIGHSGAWLAFMSDYVRFPKEQLSVIVLFNQNYAGPDEPRIGLQVADIFLE